MATISEVARAAGVSTSTVSYVLSGKRSISAETRERVQRSIEALGYSPHAGARALASSRTNVLALVVPLRANVIVPVIMQFVAAVATTARRYDHDVLLLTSDEGPAGLRRVSQSAMVDALLVMDVEAEDPRVPVLAALPQPAVLIGVPRRSAGLSCVDLDFAAAGELAVTHLHAHGHTRVALLGPAPAVVERGTAYATHLVRGFSEGLERTGAAGFWQPCAPDAAGVRDALDRVERDLPGATALVVHNEEALPLVVEELARRGRRVPDDVSLLALCPDDVARAQVVAMSSISIPAYEIGSAAVDLAMDQIAGRRAPETRLLAPALTERGSCCDVAEQPAER